MVRTRFAPSPTGYLHIGGVRTALFNWLYARQHGGQFLLRIDDTDAARNVEAALQPILAGFRWLGIDWDEGPEVGGPYGPYYQSQRLARYQEAAAELLARGFAYKDYAKTEELDAERKAADAAKVAFLYSRNWMGDTPEKCAAFEAEGRKAVLRLKMPREGKLVLQDEVRGQVEFDWAREQDHVVQRNDGTCLYHLASVVDDYDFKISHVIRAEEHLPNTPRQVFIAQSLGYALPVYAHLPYVAEPGSKNKLSKRKIAQYMKNRDFAQLHEHGSKIAKVLGIDTTAPESFNPVLVEFYEKVGYLPQAILNYLLLLGWSLDDKTEFIDRETMIKSFSLERVVKASASFDPKKLWNFEDHYMRELPLDDKVEQMAPYLIQAGLLKDLEAPGERAKLARIIVAGGDRIKVAGDILMYSDYFYRSDAELPYDEDAFAKRVKAPGAIELLQQVHALLPTVTPWDEPAIDKALHGFVVERGIKMADMVHPLRLALTGQPVGPGLFDCIEILGLASTQARIERAIAKAEAK